MPSPSSQTPPTSQPPADHLRVERPAAGVVRLVLDNPEQRNAMSAPMTAAWTAAMAELREDPDVRVVVVTGEGSAFCSGGDTSWIASEPDAPVHALRERMLAFYRAWLEVRSLPVPTIAALNGPAIGAGLCLALACDLRYTVPGAKLGAPFLRLGMNPGMAATYLLPDVVGEAAARELLLTGRLVQGEEAREMGLVNQVLEAEGFADAVLEVAGQVAAGAPLATRYTTRALRHGHADLAACVEWEAFAQPVTLATEDLQEGIAAARERRTPRFEGR